MNEIGCNLVGLPKGKKELLAVLEFSRSKVAQIGPSGTELSPQH